MNVKEYLKSHQILSDGALGTYYAEKYPQQTNIPEQENEEETIWKSMGKEELFQQKEEPGERILQIHKEYLQAGAKLLRTNTFSSSLTSLYAECHRISRKEQLFYQWENVKTAIYLAKKAIEETKSSALVAGDIGPVPEHGKDTEEILEEYYNMADAHLSCGADLIWMETFSDFQYVSKVAEYVKKKKDIFVMASFCLNKFGYTRSGLSVTGILEEAKKSHCIDGVGFNCGIGSTHMYQILKNVDFGDLIVSVMPNSGYPDVMNDRTNYQENIGYFCENLQKIAALGVNIIGGCCGTTPSYIREYSKFLPKETQLPQRKQQVTISIPEEIEKENNEFYKKLHSGKKTIVVELDPPHNSNCEKVIQAALLLKEEGVDILTFSDSPMGKQRADSILISAGIHRELEIPVMPHVTCRDKNKIAMGASFFGAHMNGIRNLLLITGDPVPTEDRSATTSVFDFNSMQLMEYVKQMNQEHFRKDPFVYGAALNYRRANLEKEIQRMQKKCQAGADYFLTQPIFDVEDIEKIRYIKSQVNTKIICGIMPLVSYRNASYMKNEVFGIHVPEEVLNRYHPDMTREQGEETGIEISLEMIEKLAEITDGYYFMVPFNRASMICKIIKRMKELCLI